MTFRLRKRLVMDSESPFRGYVLLERVMKPDNAVIVGIDALGKRKTMLAVLTRTTVPQDGPSLSDAGTLEPSQSRSSAGSKCLA